MEDVLEVFDGNLVAAAVAHVLRRVRRDVHLPTAVAVRHPGKEMPRRLGWPLSRALPGFEHRIARVPKLLTDNRLHICEHPLTLRFQLPRALVVSARRVVGPADAARSRVLDEPGDGRVRERRAVP